MSKLLITLESIKANSLIEPNAEPLKLRQSALEAQRVQNRSVLGATLQDLFLAAIDDNGSPTGLTSTQQTFYDIYLTQLFAKQVEEVFIAATHYKISNTGLQQITTDNTAPASDAAVRDAINRAKNAADYFAERAKRFILLAENKIDLGDYYLAGEQNIEPATKVSRGSIYCGPRR